MKKKSPKVLAPVNPIGQIPLARDVDAISRRAYELWEKDGSQHGRHLDHWYQAERELDAHSHAEVPASAAPAEPVEPDIP